MKYLQSQADFVALFQKHYKPQWLPTKFKKRREEDFWFSGKGYLSDEKLIISNELFDFIKIFDGRFSNLLFENCVFQNCSLDSCDYDLTIFKNCKWISCQFNYGSFSVCDLIGCEFIACNIAGFEFHETNLSDVCIKDCIEFIDSTFYRGGERQKVSFIRSEMLGCYFSSTLNTVDSYTFQNSTIGECTFTSCNFSKSFFKRMNFVRNVFSNCILTAKTIDSSCSCEEGNYSSIDLHTVNASEVIHPTVLEKVFGITEPDIKGFANGLTRKVELQSAFISYSFKDKEFASVLNHALMMKGVVTFLWEKDAPGGQPLRKIMSENVHKHERLIFIASENSIKSEACQYELTQGRERQDKDWTTILFPIHIDGYLFKVIEDDIRPREKRPEYWKNIQELRDINSTDFSAFNKPRPNKDAFDKAISKLVKDLRKDRSKE